MTNLTAKLIAKIENDGVPPSLTFTIGEPPGGHLNVAVSEEEFATFKVGNSYTVSFAEVQGE